MDDLNLALKQTVHSYASADQPGAVYDTFHETCRELFGLRIMTVFRWRPGDNDCVRVWSNLPEQYPFPSRKPMGPTEWGRVVLHDQMAWSGLTVESIEEAFFDSPLIKSLGCGCCLSAAVVWNGQTIGAASILDVEGRYAAGDAERFASLAPALVPALL